MARAGRIGHPARSDRSVRFFLKVASCLLERFETGGVRPWRRRRGAAGGRPLDDDDFLSPTRAIPRTTGRVACPARRSDVPLHDPVSSVRSVIGRAGRAAAGCGTLSVRPTWRRSRRAAFRAERHRLTHRVAKSQCEVGIASLVRRFDTCGARDARPRRSRRSGSARRRAARSPFGNAKFSLRVLAAEPLLRSGRNRRGTAAKAQAIRAERSKSMRSDVRTAGRCEHAKSDVQADVLG